MRRTFAAVLALVASCTLRPLPAQYVEIPGPDTITLREGMAIVLEPIAYDSRTRPRRVARARFDCEAVSPLSVRGDTLRLHAAGLNGMHIVRCVWLRSDGLRLSDSVFVQSETPQLPPVEVPPPDDEPDTTGALVLAFDYSCNGYDCTFDRRPTQRPAPDAGLATGWRFHEDGRTIPLGANAIVTHRWSSAGQKTVTLYVRATTGDSAALTKTIIVQAPTTPDTSTPAPPDTTTTPPPETPSGFGNEPAGFTRFVDRPFHTKHPTYCSTCSPKEYPNKADLPLAEGFNNTEGSSAHGAHNFTIVDSLSPQGDRAVAQIRYPAGMRSGVGAHTATFTLPSGIREAYISFWMKLSPNWIGNQSNTNKMFFVGVGDGNNQFIFNAYGREAGPLRATPHVQGIMDTDAPGHGHLHAPNLGEPAIITRGQWQRFEFLFRCNSAPGVPDGEMHMWVDGRKVFEERTTNWTRKSQPTEPCSINVFNWNGTYGGGGRGVPFNDRDVWTRGGGDSVLTKSRTYILSQSQLSLSLRASDARDFPSPSPDFRILPGIDDQYQFVDRIYISGR